MYLGNLQVYSTTPYPNSNPTKSIPFTSLLLAQPWKSHKEQRCTEYSIFYGIETAPPWLARRDRAQRAFVRNGHLLYLSPTSTAQKHGPLRNENIQLLWTKHWVIGMGLLETELWTLTGSILESNFIFPETVNTQECSNLSSLAFASGLLSGTCGSFWRLPGPWSTVALSGPQVSWTPGDWTLLQRPFVSSLTCSPVSAVSTQPRAAGLRQTPSIDMQGSWPGYKLPVPLFGH